MANENHIFVVFNELINVQNPQFKILKTIKVLEIVNLNLREGGGFHADFIQIWTTFVKHILNQF